MEQVAGVHTGGYLLMEGAMVAAGPFPTMRRRQLGMELRRLRDAAGKSQEEAAEWAGLSHATAMSKIERGKQRIDQGRLRLLMQLYNVTSPHDAALERLRRDADQRGWWVEYGESVPDWFKQYLDSETVAAEIWTFEALVIPGLLQTSDYATTLTAAVKPTDAEEAERFAEVRAARQRRLTGDDPLAVHAIIDEAALRRPVGGPDVMQRQIDRLLEVAALSNVTLQILPFSAGSHPGTLGAFTCLRFPEEPMNAVYIELDGGALYLERPSQVERYAATFKRLVDQALSKSATIQFLEQERRR